MFVKWECVICGSVADSILRQWISVNRFCLTINAKLLNPILILLLTKHTTFVTSNLIFYDLWAMSQVPYVIAEPVHVISISHIIIFKNCWNFPTARMQYLFTYPWHNNMLVPLLIAAEWWAKRQRENEKANGKFFVQSFLHLIISEHKFLFTQLSYIVRIKRITRITE